MSKISLAIPLALRAALIALPFTLAACTLERSTQPLPKPSPLASVVPKVQPVKKASPQKDERYQLALDQADSAENISESAQSREDWQLVASRWQKAIALLQQVPKNDANRKLANQKLPEFQKQLARAQAKVDGIGKEKIATLDPGITVDAPLSATEMAANLERTHRGFRIPIKYRHQRIPVVDVIFNGNQTFEMLVDTGASATMITEAMARSLQVEIIGSGTAMTAAGASNVDIAMVKSISIGGSSIRNVPVSIGPLPIGLLGHDFFGDCDMSITQNYIEFKQCGI